MDSTIRVEAATREKIQALAEATDSSMQTVVEQAVAEYERKVFWERTNARYAGLRRDQKAWAEILAEREGLAGSFRDGSRRLIAES